MKTLLVLLMTTLAPAALAQSAATRLHLTASDRTALVLTVEALFNAVDARDWAAAEALMTERITADYQSLSGQPAVTLTPAELIAGWRQVLPGFLATQHMLSNHQVRLIAADSAEVRSYGQAFHHLPNGEGSSVWTVVGRYRCELVQRPSGWRIRAIRFELLFQDGNLRLPALAAERIKAQR